jgi:hypothetical protein
MQPLISDGGSLSEKNKQIREFKRGFMPEPSNPRDAAIKAFQDREARTRKFAAEQESQRREQAQRQEQNLITWTTSTFHAISLGVMEANNDFAQRRSPFVFNQRPIATRGVVAYEIRRSGSLNPEALLAFTLKADGLVHAETDARRAALPHAVAIVEVTAKWAERVAEQVMIAVLGGGQNAGVEE